MLSVSGPIWRLIVCVTIAASFPAFGKEKPVEHFETLLEPSSGAEGKKLWEKRRDELRAKWLEVLGAFPAKPALEARELTSQTLEDHVRYLVRYQSEPGVFVHAFLLVPRQLRGRAPAAVVFHGTSNNHIYQPVGLADASTRHVALALVRRGYVTLCPRCYIFGYGEDELSTRPRGAKEWNEATDQVLKKHPGWSGMGKMVWDGMRALDYLETRPEVDPSRMVCAGHSLGAKESLYLAAFDTRVKAAVASEGGVGLALSNWDASWYLGKRMPAAGSPRDHQELLALVAPRALLVAGGGQADGDKSRPWMDAARPVFDLYGRPENLVLLVHDKGHDFPVETREKAFDWLDDKVRRESR